MALNPLMIRKACFLYNADIWRRSCGQKVSELIKTSD